MLVFITVPAISLLFFQNIQVQTSVSEYLTKKLSKQLDVEVSVSSVNYSFFKRLQIYDLYMEDEYGDTLMYAERCNARVKKFRPDNNIIQIRRIDFENALFRLAINDKRISTLQFLIDSLKRDIAPEDKTTLNINQVHFRDSRFRLLDSLSARPPGGIDFSNLDVRNLNIDITDLEFKQDTTSMEVKYLSGNEVTGFIMENVGFDLAFSKTFLTFSDGWVNTILSKAKVPVVEFRYEHPKQFKHFFDSVNIYISSDNSMLDFVDIAAFFPEINDLSGLINVNGAIFGSFGDFKGENIHVDYLDDTRLWFDMRLAGLPEKDSIYMDFEFREFRTTPEEIRKLTAQSDIRIIKDSMNYEGLNNVLYTGSFRGYKTDFETAGSFKTNLGNINVDLNMKPEAPQSLHFNGNINTGGFGLGKLLGKEPDMGRINFSINLDGYKQQGKVETAVSGVIDNFELIGYDYSNIQLEGNFTNRKFDGSMLIRDPNIDLIFTGSIDYEDLVPAFQFNLDVANLRPYYLNLREDDPEYFASFFLDTDMTGNRLENLNGEVQLVNSTFRRTGAELLLNDIHVKIGNSPDQSFIKLLSDQADAEITGKYNIRELHQSFTGILNEHFELFDDLPALMDSTTHFSFNASLHNVNPILEFFYPDLKVAPDFSFTGNLIPGNNNYQLSVGGSLPDFQYKEIRWVNLLFNMKADTNMLSMQFSGDKLETVGGFEIEQPVIDVNFKDNNYDLSINWDNNSTPSYAGNIVTNGKVSNEPDSERIYSMTIEPSSFYYNNRKFTIPHSSLLIDSSGISIDSIYIKGTDQFLLAEGKYAANSNDSIIMSLKNLNLHFLNDVNNEIPIDLYGILSGHVTIKSENSKPLITSNLIVSDLEINDQFFGNTLIRADWIRTRKEIKIELLSDGNESNNINVKGLYKPGNKNLNFDLRLSDINLYTFQPYLDNNLENLSGKGDLNLFITGTTDKPNVNGTVNFRESSAVITETQSRYFFSDELRISDNNLYFDNFKIFDSYGSSMSAQGNITTTYFDNPFMNITLEAKNFNFLSTTRFNNEQFYGDVFASAKIDLNGPLNRLRIRASANTEKYTNLKLPLYNAAEIQTTDFITFVKLEDEVDPSVTAREEGRRNIILDMDLTINSNTSVQLIFDPKVGDIIEASGHGTLKLELDENGDFSMFGNVLVEDGEYLFTLQNVINKRFRIKPGGSISWNGLPTSANINLEAVYETKASTYSLAPNPTEDMKKRIPVHCLLSLQGELKNPTIVPRIYLPTAEPETRSLVETSIGTDEELMRQFISLLVINNFISSSEFSGSPIGGASTGLAGVTASELLSNQLSNWLSQISTDFDIGINYRPGDAVSTDEVELALSTQLLNDRIIFSGNLDVLGDEVTTPGGEASNIVGDFDLEFRVSDKVSIKAFNRVNDDRIVRPSLYTQGVGLIYRSEFNSIKDLFNSNKGTQSDDEQLQKINEDVIIREDESDNELP
ncbi:MAG: translocation/assembly module TamB domain-containing protein [Bacteroidales bacterium]